MFYANEKIAVLIDGGNLFATSKILGMDIDYKTLRQEFMRRGNLKALSYYTVIHENEEFNPLRPLLDWLDYNGYRVKTKAGREHMDREGRLRVKGDISVEITVDAMEIAAHVDHIVLFSGDGDFAPLVQALQRKGCRVTVVSTLKGSNSILSDELRRKADTFIDLEDLRDAVGRPPREGRQDRAEAV